MSRSKKHIAIVSLMFLIVYAGAFTANALCDLEVLDYASNFSHQHDDGGEHPSSNHHDEVENGHDQHSHGTENEAGETDECCDEISSTLEASLFFSHTKAALPAVKYFLIKTIDFSTKSIFNYKQINAVYHEYDLPPPLDGFSIRVVIQSFLN